MDILESLFLSLTKQECTRRTPLSKGGSRRRYFRLAAGQGPSCIGVIGTDKDENAAFMAISAHFRKTAWRTSRKTWAMTTFTM